jgi:hypothetical protein
MNGNKWEAHLHAEFDLAHSYPPSSPRPFNPYAKVQLRLLYGSLPTFSVVAIYEGVSKSFRTGCLERELKMVSSLPLGAVLSLFCESV